MTSLAQKLTEIARQAFAAQGLSEEFGLVHVSDRPDLAQFQCNGALAAAKSSGRKPREVAEAIIRHLNPSPDLPPLASGGRSPSPSGRGRRGEAERGEGVQVFSKIEIAGP